MIHAVKEYQDKRPIPYCRKTPFAQWPKVVGVGVHELRALGHRPCPECRKKVQSAEGIDMVE